MKSLFFVLYLSAEIKKRAISSLQDYEQSKYEYNQNNKTMEEQLNNILLNPTVGRIATIIIGIAIIWIIIKVVQKNLFPKIKDNDHRYKAKKFILYYRRIEDEQEKTSREIIH